MDGNRFDEMAKALPGNRRTVLTGAAAMAAGGILSALSPRTARARKPRPKPAYTCPRPYDVNSSFANGARVAQSFTATRSGTLRQIKILVFKNPSSPGGDYLVQVVRMAGTVPSNDAIDVIAAAVVPDAQVKTDETTLVANFGTTKLTQGTQYAVVVSRPAGLSLFRRLGGDDCEGDLFIASSTGAFSAPSNASDMIVTVLVA